MRADEARAISDKANELDLNEDVSVWLADTLKLVLACAEKGNYRIEVPRPSASGWKVAEDTLRDMGYKAECGGNYWMSVEW